MGNGLSGHLMANISCSPQVGYDQQAGLTSGKSVAGLNPRPMAGDWASVQDVPAAGME